MSHSNIPEGVLRHPNNNMAGIVELIYYPNKSDNDAGPTYQLISSKMVTLTKSNMDLNVTHTIAEVTVQQSYWNDTSEPFEAFLLVAKDFREFHFIDWKIKDTQDSGRIIHQSSIVPLTKAELQIGKQFRQHGILERRVSTDCQFIKCSMGNMYSGMTVEVEFVLKAELRPVGLSKLELVIPGRIFGECLRKMTEFSGSVTVKSGGAIENWDSPSHQSIFQIKEESSGDKGKCCYTYTEARTESRDFHLTMTMKEHSKSVLLVEKRRSKIPKSKRSGSVALMFHYNMPKLHSKFVGTEIIIAVSYSKQYGIILKDNLEALMQAIPFNCKFNVVYANGETSFKESRRANSERIKRIYKTVEDAMKETEESNRDHPDTLEAIKKTFRLPILQNIPHRRVILVTDSEMDNVEIEDIQKAWKLRPDNCAFFAVVVGKRSPLLQNMTELGLGTSIFIEKCSVQSRADVKSLVSKATKVDVKVCVTWKDSEGRSMGVKGNGQGDGFVQVPAVITSLGNQGEELKVFAISENSNLLPTSVEVSVKSPSNTILREIKHVRDGMVVSSGLTNIATAEMLLSGDEEMREHALSLANKLGMMREGSTVVPTTADGRNSVNYWILPYPPGRNPHQNPSTMYHEGGAFMESEFEGMLVPHEGAHLDLD